MQTSLAAFIKDTPDGREAERILRSCVHCGFCNATCPTYQILGNELDGPRGRIYLIKQLLEGAPASEKTLTHLDRCLTCRNCETTCPSGVQYGRLADIGRGVAEAEVGRPWPDRLLRWGLRRIFPFPARVRVLFAAARAFSPLLPARLHEMLPPLESGGAADPVLAQPGASGGPTRRMVLLGGCVQAAAAPSINRATRKTLAHLGIEGVESSRAGCCGAMSHHLNQPAEARRFIRRNIDAWTPLLDAGAEAIVVNASGCGAVIKEYGYLMRDDPDYAERAARVSERTRDLSEVISVDALSKSLAPAHSSIAFHPPCTLQHGLKLGGKVEGLLRSLGFSLVPFRDSHLCCGSAGTYSILEPKLAKELLTRKLAAIEAGHPSEVLTANIGCLLHLQRQAKVPVRHWVEAVAERLPPGVSDG